MANPFVHVELNTPDPQKRRVILFGTIPVAVRRCAQPGCTNRSLYHHQLFATTN